MADKALGCDVSHWQGEINFEKMHDVGASFVFLKASQATWTDRRFIENYRAAKQAGLLVGMYHYLDWSVPSGQQARYFAGLIADYPPDIEPVIDYEERRNAPNRLAAISALNAFIQTVEDLIGRLCVIYTSPGYWREYGDTSDRWKKYPLWVAHYGVTRPTVPVPWTDWLFWQYTDKGDGALYGVESKQIDLNWFNGTVEQLQQRYQSNSIVSPPPIMNPVRLRVVVPVLNIRQGPSTSSARIGDLRHGTQVIVESIKVENARRVWIKHSVGWSALVYDGSVFMQEIL